MPRDLAKSDRNDLTLRDPLSGAEFVFFYRTPTTTDRVGYMKTKVVRVGNKIFVRVHEAMLKYGLEILTGIRPGDFVVDGQPLASDPIQPGYREDWKELLAEMAGDLVIILGQRMFEGALPVDAAKTVLAEEDEIPPALDDEPAVDLEAGAAVVPLAKSSPASAKDARRREK